MKLSHIDGVWILLAASLVFFMQAGFAARETGLTRSKNSVNAVSKLLGGTLVVAFLFWLVGFALLAGPGDFVGSGELAVSGDTEPGLLARFFFFLALACVPGAIFSGAVAERVRLVPHMLVVGVFGVAVFPIFGHWAVGGWLAERGFVDLGGATWVHTLGGFLALAGVIAVGPRSGRFGKDRRPATIPGSSLPLAILGTFILWVGFLGENGGQAVGADSRLAHIIANTMVSGASGGLAALAIGWPLRRKPEVELPMNGLLAGLVAIAGAGHAVATPAALIIGAAAGAITLGVDRLLVRAGLDDAVGAVPVHLGGGLLGTLCVGLFGDPAVLGTKLTRVGQIKVQVEGLLVAGIYGFALAFGALKLIGLVTRLRGSAEDEAAGLNIAEHGAHTDSVDLVDVMEEQARTGDLTLRANVEPFTEVGAIARQYNRVMETVAFTTAQTESLVRTSLDALLTFNTDGIITSSNPAASAIFGYSERELRSVVVTSLFAPSRDAANRGRADLPTLLKTFVGQTREVRGQRRSSEEFPMEASFNYVSVGEDEIYTATIRDVTQRKETEAELNRAQAEIRRRLEQELEDAKVVQKALLPVESQFPGCEIARHYQSASETGGDWYGYYYYPEAQSITFYMGDVTGHGLPSALLSGVVCGAVYSSEYTHGILGGTRAADRQLKNLAEVVNRIVLQTGKGELLMTMAFMHVNLRTGQVAFLNAGHNMPFVIKNGGEGTNVTNLVARGSRLGESNKPEFDVVHAKLEPGDLVVLYTDGLLENQGPDGRVLSMRELKQVLSTRRPAADIRDELVARAKGVWGNQPLADDHSILVFRWTPQAPAQNEKKSTTPTPASTPSAAPGAGSKIA